MIDDREVFPMIVAVSGPAAWVWCVAIVCATILALAFTLKWWFGEDKSSVDL